MLLQQLFLPILAVLSSGISVSATPVPEEGAAEVRPRSNIVKRSFLQTCLGPASQPDHIFTLTNGAILNGECLTPNQQWNPTSLNLNGCITNSDGFLLWRSGGSFKASCPNTGLRHTFFTADAAIDQVYLWADCYTAGGALRRSEIRLNDRIHNWSGVLGCTP